MAEAGAQDERPKPSAVQAARLRRAVPRVTGAPLTVFCSGVEISILRPGKASPPHNDLIPPTHARHLEQFESRVASYILE